MNLESEPSGLDLEDLSSYHIPFLWGRNYNVSFTDFLFADAHVTSKLAYLQL